MKYRVYHDESKEGGYWHGMLLVPEKNREKLLGFLKSARKQISYDHAISLKDVGNQGGKIYRLARSWISIGCSSLIQKEEGLPVPYFDGEGGRKPEPTLLRDLIGAKFILFKIRGGLDFEDYPDWASMVETTFRMGLKGGLHLFEDQSRDLTIVSLHFDGHEHYGRHVNETRIVERMKGLRDTVDLSDNIEIYDGSSDHSRENSQDYDDCQLIQLTDLFVSGFRCLIGPSGNEVQERVARPLYDLYERWIQGKKRMTNSKYYQGICFSECDDENEQWSFYPLKPDRPNQLSMFGNDR